MAGTNLLALIDDIATILDDVAAMTKAAAKKTAGVLGDDLALNAEQVVGVSVDRELPVVWAVAKGSFWNKLILVPAALAISALAPWIITPLLMVGGAFLCFEGFEKLAHKLTHTKAEETSGRQDLAQALRDPNVDMIAFEKGKIRGAVRTDFVLSAEIIVITLGVVASAPIISRVAVLSGIALLMTAGVYGLVAGIVKLDDGGLSLTRQTGQGFFQRIKRAIGTFILLGAPYAMKGLSIAGMIAMFMVGGGILAHGVPGVEALVHTVAESAAGAPAFGAFLEALAPVVINGAVGLLAGAAAIVVVAAVGRLRPSTEGQPATK